MCRLLGPSFVQGLDVVDLEVQGQDVVNLEYSSLAALSAPVPVPFKCLHCRASCQRRHDPVGRCRASLDHDMGKPAAGLR